MAYSVIDFPQVIFSEIDFPEMLFSVRDSPRWYSHSPDVVF